MAALRVWSVPDGWVPRAAARLGVGMRTLKMELATRTDASRPGLRLEQRGAAADYYGRCRARQAVWLWRCYCHCPTPLTHALSPPARQLSPISA
eukprot:scaffold216_cov78-Isochrysis_galbana.AAC.6